MANRGYKYCFAVSIALGLGLAVSSAAVSSATAAIAAVPQPATSQAQSSSRGTVVANRQLGFTVNNVRASRGRIGGIQRGPCQTGNPALSQVTTSNPSDDCAAINRLMALLPPNNPDLEQQGLVKVEATLSDRPTFFVYVPEATDVGQSPRVIEFMISTKNPPDEDLSETLYEAQLVVPNHSSIVTITLPDSAPALEVNGSYHWAVTLVRDLSDYSGNPIVDGWVERIEPEAGLLSQLQNSAPEDRPALLAAAGLWQDTLASLVQLRQQNPADSSVTADWVSLLTSVDLEAIAEVPVVVLPFPVPTAGDGPQPAPVAAP
ncbi:MAG TPA: DUF928 domain-containing protein [Chroococcidiopsis sp.]